MDTEKKGLTAAEVEQRQKDDAAFADLQQRLALWFESALNGSVTFPETSGGKPLTPDERLKHALNRFLESKKS